MGVDSHIGASTIPPTIIGINSDHIENQVVSKFWADSNDMEEDDSDNGEETVRTITVNEDEYSLSDVML